MAASTQADRGDRDGGGEPKGSEGLSAFVARVLDQLSVSAWLPAALLIATLALFVEFRTEKSANVGEAIKRLTDNPWRVLTLLLPLLVIATMVTQAFSYWSIQILQGYWGRGRLLAGVSDILIRRQVRARKQIDKRMAKAELRAFHAVKSELKRRHGKKVVALIRAEAHGRPSPADALPDHMDEAERVDWLTTAPAWLWARVDSEIQAAGRYPKKLYRILPTRLGNLIRATTDELRVDGDLQTFAMRRREAMPTRVQLQHDQFRSRLDMYCTLVFVAATLAAAAPVILIGRVHWEQQVAIVVILLVLAVISYTAAIASATGYCAILRRMNES